MELVEEWEEETAGAWARVFKIDIRSEEEMRQSEKIDTILHDVAKKCSSCQRTKFATYRSGWKRSGTLGWGRCGRLGWLWTKVQRRRSS